MRSDDGRLGDAPKPPPRSCLREWVGRSLYVLFLLVVVEFSFRAFYPLTAGAFLVSRAAAPRFVEDPDSGWAPKPNLSFRHRNPEFDIDVYTNSRGFRTSRQHEEYPTGRVEARHRIMLLGPSLAFGWGVNYEQTIAAQLPALLAQERFGDGRKLELINRAFVDDLGEHGIPCLNPTDDLAAEARWCPRRLYYWLDIHWAVDGNRLVAQAVADQLVARPEWMKYL